MDPREQPFADIMAPMDFSGEDSLLEGEIVEEGAEEQPVAPEEPAQLDLAALMQEAFGSL